MARYLKAHEGIDVSRNFVADLWRDNGLQPHRTGTFKVQTEKRTTTTSATARRMKSSRLRVS